MPGREPRRVKKVRGGLGEDIHADRFVGTRERARSSEKRKVDKDGFLMPSGATNKILRAARKQLQTEVVDGDEVYEDEDAAPVADAEEEAAVEMLAGDEDRYAHLDEEEDTGALLPVGGDAEDEEDEEVELEYDDRESVATDMESFADVGEQFDIDDEEARLLEKFQPKTGMQTRTLADVILGKIKDKEDAENAEANGPASNVDKRVARVYIAIGKVLQRYTSGKIPKAFKILPHIQNWEELIMLTAPHMWSPHATYHATRIFASNLNEKMAQRFFSAILLPIVMEKIVQDRKLHPALYMAIRKALFKPLAFFKGFLLPLITDSDCTLKMSLIVASVLQKMHLPPVPTAVTIVKLTMMPFSGPNCVFLRVLIDKKMGLPYQAIDALVRYFHRFIRTHSEEELLPVLWHQTLLSFCQRYKGDLTREQIAFIREVCSKHYHRLITAEIRRELNAAVQKLDALGRD